jgi:uroporphyrinogen-III synthase
MNRLKGKTILVPESRELDLFSSMLEAEGATAFRCPLVAIEEPDNPAPVRDWITRITVSGCDDLILQTGEGLRRLVAIAEREHVKDAFVAAIGRARIVVRGPKPVRALRDVGLRPSLSADQPTSAGLIAALADESLGGRRVALQSYPEAPSELVDYLLSRGATVDAVVPYRYASGAENARVVEAIELMANGAIDVAAFTSSPQVRRLSEVARQSGLEAKLAHGLSKTMIAAIGPVAVAALENLGVRVTITPSGNYHLKPLVNEIAKAVEASG